MTVLKNTIKGVYDKLDVIKNSPKLKDLIIIDKLLAYVPSWPLIVHLLSGFMCLGFSAIFHLFQI